MITILAGGTGSVKLVRGITSQPNDVTVISNVGDNYWLYGLYICPDIDTILYGLADLLDYERGWGVKKDTFGFLRQMEILGEENWFRVGDRDAATHLIRTNMLKNGKNLSDITFDEPVSGASVADFTKPDDVPKPSPTFPLINFFPY